MPTVPSGPMTVEDYDAAARAYLASLPLSHFMESTPQATQRKITLESFDLVHAAREDVQCFNELLIQYPGVKRKKLGQVVPDNFVVVYPTAIDAVGSFNTELQPVGPILVLEYVSAGNKRKDYEDNFKRYEKELKVPYYLIFNPDREEVALYHLGAKGYIAIQENGSGRFEVPELELEVALHEGWVRFWFRGELLPLPADLLKQRDEERSARREAEQARKKAEARAAAAEAELARLKEKTGKDEGREERAS